VLHPGALGDTVLSLPAIGLVRNRFPGVPLTLAGNSDYIPAVAHGYAERVSTLSTIPLHRLYTPGPLSPEDQCFWKSYSRIIAWTGFGDSIFQEQLRALCPDSLIAAWRSESDGPRHVARIFIDSLQPWLGEMPSVPLPKITVPSVPQAQADAWLREQGWIADCPLIAVHTGAGNREKRWPLSGYGKLVWALAGHRNCRVVVIEGPAEKGTGAAVVEGIAAGYAVVASGLSAGTVAGILARCTAFVGNDSGISHLAAGIGVPSVVLFGPTRPDIWGPLGPHVEILRDTRSCRACETRSDNSHRCLDNIRPETVLDRVTAILDSAP
jgi:heptosyltransferase III